MAYIMENMTVKDMEEAIKKTKTLILPIGLSEQHGYHLPLSTDIIGAEALIMEVKDEINCVIAPTLKYCYSGGELLGTINVSPSIFSIFVTEIAKSIFNQGFKNMVIMLGHGGTENFQALKNELTIFLKSNPQFEDKNIFVLRGYGYFLSKETKKMIIL